MELALASAIGILTAAGVYLLLRARTFDVILGLTLLIVGGADAEVLALNRRAVRELHCSKRLEVVPGATHLFEEPGALGSVAQLAAEWFETHLGRRPQVA